MLKTGNKQGHRVGYGRPPIEHRFRPGRSGNAKGRPRGSASVVSALKRLLHKGDELLGRDLAEALARVAIREALKGNFQFWKAIIDRTDGPIAHRIEHDIDDEGADQRRTELRELSARAMRDPEVLRLLQALHDRLHGPADNDEETDHKPLRLAS